MVEETLMQMNLEVETEDGDPYEQARAVRQLRDEIKALDEKEVTLVTQNSPHKSTRSIDPMIIGTVVAAGPVVLLKFLDFLHAWAMRHEGRTVKIRINRQQGDSIEIEVPYTMSLPEVKKWIATVQKYP